MEPKTGKRIVSKGEYAKAQGKRALLTMFSFALTLLIVPLFLFAALAGLISCVFLIFACCGWNTVGIFGSSLFICLFCAAFSYGNALLLVATEKQLEMIAPSLPLTRANTAHLPAPDSLVRASSEPQQAQEGVLLRAAASGVETPSEQLVRASVGQE